MFISPVPINKTLADDDYRIVRRVLKELSAEGKYFAYCPGDDTLIWHQGRGPWQLDDRGSQFIAFAREKSSDKHAVTTLEYFKRSCFSSHIDKEMKAKRLTSK